MVQSTMPSWTMYGYRNGRVGDLIQIGGTGNTYLAGTTLDLGFGGEIQFTGTQNFTNLTAITFAGGMLDLTAANSFPNMGGFDVTQGVLAVSSNLTMGADNTNGITLGSAARHRLHDGPRRQRRGQLHHPRDHAFGRGR